MGLSTSLLTVRIVGNPETERGLVHLVKNRGLVFRAGAVSRVTGYSEVTSAFQKPQFLRQRRPPLPAACFVVLTRGLERPLFNPYIEVGS